MTDARNEELHRKLREENRELAELNHFKTHLLSLTSHEMKTPLGIIRGYAALLREGHYGDIDPQAKEIIGKIEFAAEDLVNLVDNVINLRKVEEGRMEYEMEDVDFVKLARQAAEELGHMATSKGLDMSFSAPDREIMVRADEQKLRHIIQNFLDNAVKYTRKGYVRAKVIEEERNAVFSVEDSGVGIPHEVIPALFQEFVRDERIRREIRGTGLGLYVARVFAEAHGGRVWVESGGEDKGSAFYLSVPKI